MFFLRRACYVCSSPSSDYFCLYVLCSFFLKLWYFLFVCRPCCVCSPLLWILMLFQTWSVQNGSNLIKLDQTWSKWISHQSKNVSIKSCHIYKKDKNGCFVLDFFWIRSVQTWSNLIKLDQIGFLTNQKMSLRKVFTFRKRIKMPVWFWIFLDQICPEWIKLDQTWWNWISH